MLKKSLALFLTLALVFSMSAVSAFAADGDVTGTADTTYVKTDILSVVLPTSNAWNFTLDPQGLVGAYKDGKIGAATAATTGQLEPYAGKIISGSFVPTAINKSSYDMTLAVDIQVTGDAVVLATSATAVATAATLASEGKTNTVAIMAYVASAAATSASTPFAGDVGVPVATYSQTLGFVLDHPEYEFKTANGTTFTYTMKAGETGNGTQIQIGGWVNPAADWSAYVKGGTKKVEVKAKFNIKKAPAGDLILAESAQAGTYNFVGVNNLTIPSGSAAATVTGTNLSTVTITPTGFTFPNGTASTYTITGITGTGSSHMSITPSSVSLDGDGKLIINLAAGWQSNSASQGWKEMKITWTDGVTITLTKGAGTDNSVTAAIS